MGVASALFPACCGKGGGGGQTSEKLHLSLAGLRQARGSNDHRKPGALQALVGPFSVESGPEATFLLGHHALLHGWLPMEKADYFPGLPSKLGRSAKTVLGC